MAVPGVAGRIQSWGTGFPTGAELGSADFPALGFDLLSEVDVLPWALVECLPCWQGCLPALAFYVEAWERGRGLCVPTAGDRAEGESGYQLSLLLFLEKLFLLFLRAKSWLNGFAACKLYLTPKRESGQLTPPPHPFTLGWERVLCASVLTRAQAALVTQLKGPDVCQGGFG